MVGKESRSWTRPSGILCSLRVCSEAGLAAGLIEFYHINGMDDRVSAVRVSYVQYRWGQRSGRWSVMGPSVTQGKDVLQPEAVQGT